MERVPYFRGDLAGLLQSCAHWRPEVHIDLARFDAWKEVPSEPWNEQHRQEWYSQETQNESSARRDHVAQQLAVAFPETPKAPLERGMNLVKITRMILVAWLALHLCP